MSKGRAKLAIDQGVSVWVLEAPGGFGDADFHAHHAIQLTCCLDGELSLASRERAVSGTLLAVAPDKVHRIEAHGLLAFIFVEPESRLGRALREQLFSDQDLVAVEVAGLRAMFESLRSTFSNDLGRDELLAVGRAVVEALAPGTAAELADLRIQRIIDYAAANLDRPLGLKEAANGLYLSPSRLRHLFVEQTGLAFKTYLLWLRLVHAVQAYSEGRSLTDAAHEAGFSDSAHFSRVFRRTFGAPATNLTRI
jgi:AraC-like DNA-binding protein